MDLQPNIIIKNSDILWICCNSVPNSSLNFLFYLRCSMNMVPGARHMETHMGSKKGKEAIMIYQGSL